MISFIHPLALGKNKLMFKEDTKASTMLAFTLVLSWKSTKLESIEYQHQNGKAMLMDGEGRESLPSKCHTF